MAKERRFLRIYATRQGRRSLELAVDAPTSAIAARRRMERLKADPDVEAIEVEERLVLPEDSDGFDRGRHGRQVWRRVRRGWRQVTR